MFARSKNNPILKPDKNNDWESRKVYNCGAIYENNQYHLFYRAVGDNWISRIGYAVSDDGILRIYYGASDSAICTATANIDDILISTRL